MTDNPNILRLLYALAGVGILTVSATLLAGTDVQEAVKVAGIFIMGWATSSSALPGIAQAVEKKTVKRVAAAVRASEAA